ncbi:MAG: sigma-70 family RNA polymerase sigma factor [Bacteroidota bacterium]
MKNIQTIIKQCKRGDEQAQNLLYRHYRNKWYMLSLRYGRNKDEASDIMQEGMVQIFRDLSQFNSKKASFATWSSRVLVHAALRYLKKHNWHHSIEETEIKQGESSLPSTIYSDLAAKELTRLIAALPLGYKLVFNMYVIEDYSHKEIAAELGITEGTSKSQLFKARKMLKEQIEKIILSEIG